ncbi:MAG: hypothetical protein HGA44_12135 [Cellulomonadaceae bacterium]|nr:hypothetical protein [Cellulomonadaceae bacterium]
MHGGVRHAHLAFATLTWRSRRWLSEVNRDLLGAAPGPGERVRRASTPRTYGMVSLFGLALGVVMIVLSFFPRLWA